MVIIDQIKKPTEKGFAICNTARRMLLIKGAHVGFNTYMEPSMNMPNDTDSQEVQEQPQPVADIPVWLHPSFLAIPDDTNLTEYD